MTPRADHPLIDRTGQKKTNWRSAQITPFEKWLRIAIVILLIAVCVMANW